MLSEKFPALPPCFKPPKNDAPDAKNNGINHGSIFILLIIFSKLVLWASILIFVVQIKCNLQQKFLLKIYS